MKKLLGITIGLLLSIILFNSCGESLTPKTLADDTKSTVTAAKEDSNNVFDEIQHNIDLVKDLRNKVSKASLTSKSLTVDDVISDIENISNSYNKLSNQHNSIKKGLLGKIETIQNMQKQVNNEIMDLKKRRADYVNQLNQVKDSNPDIVKTRKDALNQAIKYVDEQIQLWVDFNNVEGNIVGQMGGVQRTVDSFLSVVDSSAILFKEALNLLKLQKNINDAMSIITQDVPKMEQLTNDMVKSWGDLDNLVNSLTNISTRNLQK
jgi:hypothetical protein